MWTPVRVAPAVAKGSADLPRMALESDGTAVAAWAENNTVRAATRLPGRGFGAPRAIATSSTLAVPDAAVAVGTRALVLLHAQQGIRRHARRLVGHRRLGRRARAGGGDHGADHRGHGRAARRRQRARRLRRRQLADDDLERGAHRPPAAGRRPATSRCRRRSRSSSSCTSSRCPTAAPCCSFLGQGPAAGDVPRPYAAVRSAAGVWSALVPLDPGAVVACDDLGLAVDAPATPTPRGASPTAACAPRRCRSAAPSASRRRPRPTARTPRVAAAPAAAACCWAGSTSSGAPALQHLGVGAGRPRHRRSRRRSRPRRRRSRASRSPTRPRPRRSSPRRPARERAALGHRRARATGGGDPVGEQSVRTGLTEPVGSPQLAMSALGAFALWVEGNVDRRLGHRSRPPARARARQAEEDRDRRARAVLGARERHLVADHDVTWRYGDGTSERGASVRHAYSRAGSLPRHGHRAATPPATRRSARSWSSPLPLASPPDGSLATATASGLSV